jgi:hypothetical protein
VKILSRSASGHVHEAELSAFEAAASEWFHDHLDTGPETQGIQATAHLALALVPRSCLDRQFVEYLSDGTLTVGSDGTVVEPDHGDAGELLGDGCS